MKRNIIIGLTIACLTLVGCSQKSSVEKTSQSFNTLPPAVQKTVRSRAPGAEIASVDKKTREGMNYFVVEFKEPGRNPKLTIAENGTILTSENEKAMGGVGSDSTTITGRWDKTTHKSDTEPNLNAPKGTTPRTANIDLSALPVPVQKTLKAQAPDAVITSLKRHDDNGRTVYEFQFEDQGKNPSMRISEDGTVVQSLKK